MKNQKILSLLLTSLGLGIVIFILFLFRQTYINNGFSWLEHGDIEQKSAIRDIKLKPIFFEKYGNTNFYRPIVTLMNSLDALLYQNNPAGYHLTNILLFLGSCIVFFLLLNTLYKGNLLVKLLFIGVVGTHTLTWLPVGSISYRPELLFTFFLLLFFFSFYKAQETTSLVWRFVIIFSAFGAVMSKETALYLIVVFAGLQLISRKKINNNSKNRLIYFDLLLVFVAYGLVRYLMVPLAWTQGNAIPFIQRLQYGLASYFSSIFLYFSPTLPLLSDVQEANIFKIIVAIIFCLGLTVATISSGDTRLKKLLVFFYLSMLPILNILPLPRIYSPHYVFFSLFILLLVVYGLFEYAPKMFYKIVLVCVLILFTVISGYHTYLGGNRFLNDYTLFEPEVAKSPKFLEGNYYLGDYYLNKIDLSTAKQYYLASVQRERSGYVDAPSAYIKLAHIAREQKNYPEALGYLQFVEQINDTMLKKIVMYDQALIYLDMDKVTEAKSILNKSMQLQPVGLLEQQLYTSLEGLQVSN